MAKQAKRAQLKRIVNRRARFDYELADELVVGLELTGAETKALRRGQGILRGAYVHIRNDELWLVGAQITNSAGISLSEQDQQRTRKLLANKREITALAQANQQGRTIVPLELLTRGRFIKLKIAVGKGKKRWDKRESQKRAQQERDIARRVAK